ncbi:hypothetical protein [Lewinella sp. JB7]|uniref:hypothetical protein n=1 Tax=Lewinella sp. JB7 TaxID=2962887 RepID=UPI0020C99C1A|nr:hypothetical protein [Lewinella sp. JB7]MCP9234713.1 hypothetical protein [Lewinella sp. JB7]
MTREHKHVIVYGAFGLLLGAKIVEVLLTRSDTGIIDWWLLLIGLAAAVVHYLPVTEKSERQNDQHQKEPTADEAASDTLVLRDHPDPERGRKSREYAPPAEPDGTGGFV